MRPPPHRRWSLPVLAVALLMAASAPAQAAESDRVAGGAQSSGLIPVWAFVNGAAPVAQARVGVTSDGKPVRQVGGRRWKRTNANGVAVLQVRHVPRQFTVVVRGGRAAGMRVRGTQRRAVTAYRHTRVVEVNPLTTLVTRLRRQRPRLNNRRAVRAVKRYFHVPRWADLGQNLRDMGDEWFDARAYVRDVRRHGSIDRLNRKVARKILSGKAPRARKSTRSPTATASQEEKSWLQMSPGELVGAGLNYLGANLAGVITQGGITAILGGLLQLAQNAGLINLPPSEMDLVREQLNAIGAQLTQLKGKIDDLTTRVERNNASQLLHQSDTVLASIDHAQAQLALLANLGQKDPTRGPFAKTIDDYIGANLVDAPAILNRQLNPALPLGDNVIKATSRALATERFFDQRDSAQVQAVYDYFATKQLQLTVLLTNYWNAHPNTYSEATRKASIAQIQANVLTTQKQSLKPPVPAGTFFDTRTPSFMWGTQSESVTAWRLQSDQLGKKTTFSLAGFGNWQMPANGDFRNLVDGASGVPRAWLQSQVEVPLRHQLWWASDSLHRSPAGNGEFDLVVTVFDMRTGREERYQYGDEHAVIGLLCDAQYRCGLENPSWAPRVREFLESKLAGLMLLRYRAPGESYWW